MAVLKSKICNTCKKELPASSFYTFFIDKKEYLRAYCKNCSCKKRNAQRKANPEQEKLLAKKRFDRQMQGFRLKVNAPGVLVKERNGQEFAKKSFVGKSSYSFGKGEKFKPINSRVFISSYGRVLALNKSDYFQELQPIRTKTGTLQISIPTDDGKYSCKMVSTLVLKHFIGGYYLQRVIRYINGDKGDCRLANLEWNDGFQNGIDTAYLLTLDNKNLEDGDKVVRNYLLYQKEWELIEYIKIHKGYFIKILKEDFKNIVEAPQLLEEIYERAKNYIENGRYIPLSTKSKKYKRLKRETDRFMLFLRIRCLDYLYHYQPFGVQDDDRSKKRHKKYFEEVADGDYDSFFSKL